MSCLPSCNICAQIPCCCPPLNECPEVIEKSCENANLAGVGVFGAEQDNVFLFRGVGSGDDIVKVNYNSTTKVIEIWLDKGKLLTQQIWNDATARNAATPDYKGQLGVQKDTNTVWTATGVGVGGWSIVKTQQTFNNNAARTAAVPDYLGQLGTQLDSGLVYRATGLAAGNWTAI